MQMYSMVHPYRSSGSLLPAALTKMKMINIHSNNESVCPHEAMRHVMLMMMMIMTCNGTAKERNRSRRRIRQKRKVHHKRQQRLLISIALVDAWKKSTSSFRQLPRRWSSTPCSIKPDECRASLTRDHLRFSQAEEKKRKNTVNVFFTAYFFEYVETEAKENNNNIVSPVCASMESFLTLVKNSRAKLTNSLSFIHPEHLRSSGRGKNENHMNQHTHTHIIWLEMKSSSSPRRSLHTHRAR